MIKHFCDICEVEIETYYGFSFLSKKLEDEFGVDHGKKIELCGSCHKKLIRLVSDFLIPDKIRKIYTGR